MGEQACVLPAEAVYLPFLVSRGCAYSLAHGPFLRLQSL